MARRSQERQEKVQETTFFNGYVEWLRRYFFIFDSASSKNISSPIRLYDRSGSPGKRRSLHAELFISEICRCGLSLSVFQPYRYKQCSSFRILKLLLPHPSLPGSGRSASPYYFVCFSCDVGLLQQKTLASAIPIL